MQSTTSVLYLMYEDGFQSWNLGSASAVAFVLFFLLFLLTRLQLALARRWSTA
jgi:multiple sugar transport system permease protein